MLLWYILQIILVPYLNDDNEADALFSNTKNHVALIRFQLKAGSTFEAEFA